MLKQTPGKEAPVPRSWAWADVAWHGQNKAQCFFTATLGTKAGASGRASYLFEASTKPTVTTAPGRCQQKSVWGV